MAQSGQGEEPSARIPREGIVLPSDGSAPLLPGEQQTAPARGRSREEPWGPDQSAAPAPPPAQPWSAQGQQAPQAPAAPAPEWGDQGWGAQQQPYHRTPQPQPEQQHYHQPQPQPQHYHQPQPEQRHYPQPQPQPYSQAPQAGAQPQSQPQPYPQGAGPLPPQAGVLDRQAGSPLPPQDGMPRAGAQGGAPMPPARAAAPADEGATRYIPPVAAHPGNEAATQFLPPVGPGALPPEVSGTSQVPSEETQYLGHLPRPGSGPMPGAGPLPPMAAPGNPDAEATQYIAPVPPQPYATGTGPGAGQRQEPDVFDSLFRSEPGAQGAGATQQMPRFEPPPGGQPPQAPYADGGRAAGRREGGGRNRTRSRVPLIAAVGVGIAALGIGAGALLADGGGDKQPDNKPLAAASDAAKSPSASADPAKEQAVALDKLLADSGDSRAAVINAVADTKRCDDLAKAATDLRDAARQRGDLVTRLSQLSVDKLPDNAALTTALTNAWKASASADNHYAAWADQTAEKKGCRKGQARTTPQAQAGNRASGTASAEKTKAAKLWNSIASTYGLTQRQPTQL